MSIPKGAAGEPATRCESKAKRHLEPPDFARNGASGSLSLRLDARLDAVGEVMGEVVGKVDVEEIPGEIFGTFCIGK